MALIPPGPDWRLSTLSFPPTHKILYPSPQVLGSRPSALASTTGKWGRHAARLWHPKGETLGAKSRLDSRHRLSLDGPGQACWVFDAFQLGQAYSFQGRLRCMLAPGTWLAWLRLPITKGRKADGRKRRRLVGVYFPREFMRFVSLSFPCGVGYSIYEESVALEYHRRRQITAIMTEPYIEKLSKDTPKQEKAFSWFPRKQLSSPRWACRRTNGNLFRG